MDEPQKKPIVIRAPSAQTTPEASAPVPSRPTSSSSSSPAKAKAKPETTEATDGSRATPGLIVTAVAGLLAEVAALFPWWTLIPHGGAGLLTRFLPPVQARATWQGLVCLFAGILVLILAAVWSSGKLHASGRRVIAFAVIGLGVVITLAAILAAVIPPLGEVETTRTFWLWVAVLAGGATITGGALLLGEVNQSSAPTPPPAGTPSGGFMVSSMEEPQGPSGD